MTRMFSRLIALAIVLSSAVTLTAATPTLTLLESPSSPYWTQTVMLTASLDTGGGAAPVVAPIFHVAGVNIAGTAWALQAGTVYQSTASFVAGPTYWNNPPVTATLFVNTTDPNYSSLSGLATLVVQQLQSSGTLSGTSTSTYPAPLTFTASLADNLGNPLTSGTVMFYYLDATTPPTGQPPNAGATYFGTGTYSGVVNGFGTWTINVPSFFPNAGDVYYLYADFCCAGPFVLPASTTYFPLIIDPQPTTVTLFNVPATINIGQTNSIVAQGAATPATNFPGSSFFDFYDNGTLLTPTHVPIGLNNSASYQLSFTTPGLHDVSVRFTPGGAYATSTDVKQGVFVPGGIDTTASIVASANPGTVGQLDTFTITVTSASGTPTGNVNFFDFGNLVATVPLINGVATYSTSTLTQGIHQIGGTYTGTPTYATSSITAINVLINAALPPSAVTLQSNLNPSNALQSVTFTANVSGGGGTPTGNVTFLDGATPLNTAALVNGTVAYTTSLLAPGPHPITASYAGDANYAASVSPSVNQVVNGPSAPTAVTLQSDVNPLAAGQTVTFTATASATGGTPTGVIDFIDGALIIGTTTLVNGVATLSTSALTSGSHTMTASFGGNGPFAASSSNSVVEVVNGIATSTAIQSGMNPLTAGQQVTFTATVSSASGTPTGSIAFYDGVPLLGNVALTAGTATYSTAALTAGAHAITAVYAASGNYTGSSSTTLSQVVNPGSTSTALQSSANPAALAQPVTFTATVSSGLGTPSGSVSFFDGVTSLGNATLSGGAATLTTSSLALGPHSITAVYAASGNFAASTSPALSQIITAAISSSTTTLQSNPASTTYGQSVTLTATVASAGGTPSGSVDFFDGATPLGTSALSGGLASLAAPLLSGGTHSITASYAGTPAFAASASAPISVDVALAAAAAQITALPNPATAGQPVTFAIALSGPGAPPTGAVALMNGTALIGTASVVNGVATIQTTMPGGQYLLTASYSGDGNYLPMTSGRYAFAVTGAADAPTLGEGALFALTALLAIAAVLMMARRA